MREEMRRRDAETWIVHLSAAAAADYRRILDWTAETFGEVQSDIYAEILEDAIAGLSGGPTTPGVKLRRDVAEGCYTFSIARRGRSARHLLIFRVRDHSSRQVEVLRILHDSMDLARHLPHSTGE